MKELIIQTVAAAVPDAEVHVDTPDGTHYQALVISPAFAGMSLVEQHRVVMNALKAQFASDEVHALKLKTFVPERWEQVKDQYPV
jgi:acid stress-induced BolA-like protein IbaG/YrbA